MRTIEEVVKQYKHICWYPSAGNDFRALLFLSDWYYNKHKVPRDKDQELPDLFILTDIRGLHDVFEPKEFDTDNGLGHTSFRRCVPGASFLHASYLGRYTDMAVKNLEELENHDFSFDPEMTFLKRGQTYNSAYLLEVEVETKKYEITNKFTATVLYISVQNEFFISEFLIPNKIKVEYQVLVRYGRDPKIPRSEELPTKIIRSYKNLDIRYLISNDEYVSDAFPDGSIDDPIYTINGGQWSAYGAVSWYKLNI